MNTTPANDASPGLRGRIAAVSTSRGFWIGVAVVLVGLTLLARGSREDDAVLESVFEVQRGPLTIGVTQPGTLQSREEVRVVCEVPGNNTVLWVIEEGTIVEAGELLVTLDSSALEEELVNQQIVVENAEAAAIRAKEDYSVKKLDEAGEVAQAELTLKLAEMDLEAYEQEEFPQTLQQAEADITIADEELQRATDKVAWSTRLAEEGYLSRTELQADQLAEKRARLNLELSRAKLRTIEEFSNARSLEKLRAEVEEAKRNLDRVHHKHKALFVQAEADIRAKEVELERQRKRLEDIQEWISLCQIKAPVAGMVVYSTTGADRRFRQRNEPVAEGVDVREGQHLISLPTAASMVARARVYESSIEKVKKGMLARITVDSLPGVVFRGTVEKIGILPEEEMSWLSSDLKSYTVDVFVEGEAVGLRPGMNCTVEIVVAEYPSALYIPLQCVIHLGSQPVVYLPHRGGPEAREVEIGLDNQSMVHILAGLTEGERVLMAPPIPVGVVKPDLEMIEPELPMDMPDEMPAGDGGPRQPSGDGAAVGARGQPDEGGPGARPGAGEGGPPAGGMPPAMGERPAGRAGQRPAGMPGQGRMPGGAPRGP